MLDLKMGSKRLFRKPDLAQPKQYAKKCQSQEQAAGDQLLLDGEQRFVRNRRHFASQGGFGRRIGGRVDSLMSKSLACQWRMDTVEE